MPVTGTNLKFKDGDLIFREGDPSASAFMIVSGAVELTKNTKHGPIILAKLKPGELFGEMGVIDGSPRTAAARSVGVTVITEIPPNALLQGIQKDAALSSKVMSKLVERVRSADEMFAKSGPQATTAASGAGGQASPKKKGFFSRFFNSQKGRTAVFEILIADLFEDEAAETTKYYFERFKQEAEKIGGGLINVRRTHQPFVMRDFEDSPVVWGQMKTNAQTWLREQDADLLIWGEKRARGQVVHLRCVQGPTLRYDQPGNIHPYDGMDLPAELDDVSAPFFYAVVIAALVPGTKEQTEAFEAILGPSMEGARAAAKKNFREFSPEERVRFDLSFAHLLATCGHIQKKPALLKEAESLYLKASRELRRTKSSLMGGIIKRHLGMTQNSWFDLGGEKNLLEAAVESLEDACNYFVRETYPIEWAELKALCGQLYFKLDQHQDEGMGLKASISSYQNALKVFSASSTPRRWADAKHNLARALQLLGSQNGDLDMIARAAEACREALVVRHKSAMPMLWAATQNNLGSALFLLSQKNRKAETAEAAIQAFEAALSVYEARKSVKLAKVTKNNLHRAQQVLEDIGPGLTPDDLQPQKTFTPDEFIKNKHSEEKPKPDRE